MNKIESIRHNRGFTLIEVLITAVVLAIGLLGLALLQTTSLNNQLEAYHRAQAMLMLEEMSNRIRVNTAAALAGAYADGDDFGTRAPTEFGLGTDDECADIIDDAVLRDLCDWNEALAGTSVMLGDTAMGSVNGAIGCIENLPGSGDGEVIVRLTIAWQGFGAHVAPASDCGEDAFGTDGDLELRRVAQVDTVIANLDD